MYQLSFSLYRKTAVHEHDEEHRERFSLSIDAETDDEAIEVAKRKVQDEYEALVKNQPNVFTRADTRLAEFDLKLIRQIEVSPIHFYVPASLAFGLERETTAT